MKRWMIIAGFFVAVLGFFIWRYSDNQVIQRKTEAFLDVITLGEDVGAGGRKLKIYKLSSLLAESISITAPFIGDDERSVYREDFEQAYSYLCDTAQETHFEVVGKSAVDVDGDSATIFCVVSGLVQMAEVRRIDGDFHVTFHWEKMDDQWRLKGMIWEELE